jgi:hypothetical protein
MKRVISNILPRFSKRLALLAVLAACFASANWLYGQVCFPPPYSANEGTFDCYTDHVMETCRFDIASDPLPSDGFCDPVDNNLYVVRLYLHLLRKASDLSGAREIADVNNAIERLQKIFSPMGILFSIEGVQYLDNDDLFNFNLDPVRATNLRNSYRSRAIQTA